MEAARMSNSLWVTLVEAEPLTRRHAGEFGIEIKEDEIRAIAGRGLGSIDIDDFLIENLAEIRSTAAKRVAGTRVEYPEAGGSDSDYLNMIDEVADHFYLKDIKVAGIDTQIYEVDAQYSPNNNYQAWTDNVEAGDETEASFRARMRLARLEGWDVMNDVKSDAGAAERLEELVSHLCEFEINRVVPFADRAEILLRELVELAEAGNIDDVIDKLKTDGRRVIGGEPSENYSAPTP
jgi:hypothetical protein